MRRKTNEVDIEVEVGSNTEIHTKDPVFDHMLKTFSFYMEIPIKVRAISWDLKHHLWEDTAILLGKGIKEKFMKDKNVARFGDCIMPMDDALVLIAVDLSSRVFLSFDVNFEEEEDEFEIALIKEFLFALTRSMGMTLHVKKLSGWSAHHISEAIFKGLGKALSKALKESQRLESTKGEL